MELLLIIMSRSPGFNSKRISECDDDDDEEEEDGVDMRIRIICQNHCKWQLIVSEIDF